MKYTNTEVEEFVDKILETIKEYREGWECNLDGDYAVCDIEKLCNEFKDKYICPYEKYTEEWYDEHGE